MDFLLNLFNPSYRHGKLLKEYGWKQNHYVDGGLRKDIYRNSKFPDYRLKISENDWRILLEDGCTLSDNLSIRNLGSDELLEQDLIEIDKCLNSVNTTHSL